MKQHSGSAILFIIFVLAFLTLYMHSLFKNNFLSAQYVHFRKENLKNQYLLEGLREYGIAWAKDGYDTIYKRLVHEKKDYTKQVHWLPSSITSEDSVGVLTFKKKKEYMILTVSLKDKPQRRLACTIKKYEDQYIVEQCTIK